MVFEPVAKRGRPRGSKNKGGSKRKKGSKKKRKPEPAPVEPEPELELDVPVRKGFRTNYARTDWSAPENRQMIETAVDDWKKKTGGCSEDMSLRVWSKVCGVPRQGPHSLTHSLVACSAF